MIRFRNWNGAEAEWDYGRWSGDPGFIALLRTKHIPSHAEQPNGDVQKLMRQELAQHGVTVVRETKPKESRSEDVGAIAPPPR